MIRVILVENMVLLRESLARILSLTSDIEVVAECGRGEEAVPLALETEPDVAVLEVRLPGLSGFEVARRLGGALPECRILFVTGYATPVNLRQAATVGALGFMAKDSSPDQLINAIRDVHAGREVFASNIVTEALNQSVSPLSIRETEVLRLAAAGEPPVSIARKLSLAEGTVRNYLWTCTVKLGARNRADAFRIAGENGWI